MGVLDGRVAIVTGAAGGLGRAISLLFAREGARLVLDDPGTERDGTGADPRAVERVAEEARALGSEVHVSTASQATQESAESIVSLASRAFGRVDTLVCAAGILADQPIARLSESAWARVISVELTGPMLLTQLVVPLMQKQGGGRIVLTTSPAGLLGNYGQPAYSAAAAGVYGFMRASSIELQRHRISVNAVAPLARTRLTSDLPLFQHVSTMTPEHVAPAYLFLGSDLCSDWTGTVLSVAGGRISQYRVTESRGRFKETDGGLWTAEEIRDALADQPRGPSA